MRTPCTIVMMVAALLLSACGPDSFLDRRDMYTVGDRGARIQLNVDWQKYFNEPSGMTVLLFPDNWTRQTVRTNDVDAVVLHADRGRNRLVLFNLTEGEFTSLNFRGLDNYDSMRVVLFPFTRPSRVTRAWSDGISFQQSPEALAVAFDTITVSNERAENADETVNYGDTVTYIYNETPRPVTTTLTLRIRVKGIINARNVEGAVSGMADGYRLAQHCGTTTTGTHFLSDWKATRDSVGNDGYITTSILTFGLPHNDDENIANRDSTASKLTLYFLLRDGTTTRTFTYNIGNLFNYVESADGIRRFTTSRTDELEVDLDNGLTLPDVPEDDSHSASGFDAQVDEWHNGSTTDVSF